MRTRVLSNHTNVRWRLAGGGAPTKHPFSSASRRRKPPLSQVEDLSVFAMAAACNFQKFAESEPFVIAGVATRQKTATFAISAVLEKDWRHVPGKGDTLCRRFCVIFPRREYSTHSRIAYPKEDIVAPDADAAIEIILDDLKRFLEHVTLEEAT